MFRRFAAASTVAKTQARNCHACITVPNAQLERLQQPGSLAGDMVLVWGTIFGFFGSIKLMCWLGSPYTGGRFDKTLLGGMN